MPHGDVAGEAAEGLAQRGDESRLVLPALVARCGVASHPVVADALPRGSHVASTIVTSARRRTCARTQDAQQTSHPGSSRGVKRSVKRQDLSWVSESVARATCRMRIRQAASRARAHA